MLWKRPKSHHRRTLIRTTRIQKTLLTLILGPPITRVGNPDVGVRHLQGQTGIGTTIRGLFDAVGTPAIGVEIVGRLLRVKTRSGPVTPIVITAAVGPADVTRSERPPHPHLGRVHQRGGAGRPQGGIEEMQGRLEIAGKIIDDDETFRVVFLFPMYIGVRMHAGFSELCGPHRRIERGQRGHVHCGIDDRPELEFASSLDTALFRPDTFGSGLHGFLVLAARLHSTSSLRTITDASSASAPLLPC